MKKKNNHQHGNRIKVQPISDKYISNRRVMNARFFFCWTIVVGGLLKYPTTSRRSCRLRRSPKNHRWLLWLYNRTQHSIVGCVCVSVFECADRRCAPPRSSVRHPRRARYMIAFYFHFLYNIDEKYNMHTHTSKHITNTDTSTRCIVYAWARTTSTTRWPTFASRSAAHCCAAAAAAVAVQHTNSIRSVYYDYYYNVWVRALHDVRRTFDARQTRSRRGSIATTSLGGSSAVLARILMEMWLKERDRNNMRMVWIDIFIFYYFPFVYWWVCICVCVSV